MWDPLAAKKKATYRPGRFYGQWKDDPSGQWLRAAQAQTQMMPPTSAGRKTYGLFQRPGTLGMAGGLAPLPSMGGTEPTTAMPSLVGVAGQPAQPGAAGTPTGLAGLGASLKAQGYPGQLPGVVSPAQAAAVPGYEQYAPGMGTDVAAQRYQQALELSPRAWQEMDPSVAAFLQYQSEKGAVGEEQARAQQALETVGPTAQQTAAATPPNLEQLMGEPGLGDAFWKSRLNQDIGATRAEFARAREQIAQQVRMGAGGRAWAQRELNNLQRGQMQAEAQARAKIANEQREFEQRARMEQTDRHLRLYGMAAPQELAREQMSAQLLRDWPSSAVDYTRGEAYMREARRQAEQDRLARQMWGGRAPIAGAGGGTAGQVFGPVEGVDTSGFGAFGGGVVATPNPYSVPAQGTAAWRRKKRKAATKRPAEGSVESEFFGAGNPYL